MCCEFLLTKEFIVIFWHRYSVYLRKKKVNLVYNTPPMNVNKDNTSTVKECVKLPVFKTAAKIP